MEKTGGKILTKTNRNRDNPRQRRNGFPFR
jgi:hypothetical protein